MALLRRGSGAGSSFVRAAYISHEYTVVRTSIENTIFRLQKKNPADFMVLHLYMYVWESELNLEELANTQN